MIRLKRLLLGLSFGLFAGQLLASIGSIPREEEGPVDRGDAKVCLKYYNDTRDKLICTFIASGSFKNPIAGQSRNATSVNKSYLPMDTELEVCFDFGEQLWYIDPDTGELVIGGAGWVLVSLDGDRGVGCEVVP